SHDFLVPLLDSIVARRTVSLWRLGRPWLSWVVAGILGIAVAAISFDVQRDPAAQLQKLGWTVTVEANSRGARLETRAEKPSWRETAQVLRTYKSSIIIDLVELTNLSGIEELASSKSVIQLTLRSRGVRDISPLHSMQNLAELSLDRTDVF